MRSKRAAVFAALALMGAAASLRSAPPSAGTSLPEGWRRESAPGSITGFGSYSVALPPTMQTVSVTGTASHVAEYRSAALTLLFDFGDHAPSRRPTCHGKSRCTMESVDVHGGRASRLHYYQPDPDGDLPYRASYEIPFGSQPARRPRRITLTVSAECASASACDLADRIVRTIEIRSAR